MADSKYNQLTAGATAAEHLKRGLHDACHAVLEDDELDAAGKASKIKAILVAHEKMAGHLNGEADDAEGDPASKGKPGVVERIALALRLGKGQRRLSERVGPKRIATVRDFARHLFGPHHCSR